MNVYDFLAQLRALDIQITAEDGRLKISAPKGAVTPQIKSELNARKAEILAVLEETDLIFVKRGRGELPLSLAQEHLWQLQRLTPETIAYNMHVVFRLHGRLNVQSLKKAMYDVVERHEILRSTFHKSADNKPEQSIAPASTISLKQVTVSSTISMPDLESVITTEIRLPFDLSDGPLFRPTLVQIDTDDHVLILAMHHIISDGQSFGIFLTDLERAYRAACDGMDVGWKPLPLQYADFAVWQRKWLEADTGKSDRRFWLDQFSDEVPALELPLDRPHSLQTIADGDYVELEIEALSTALNDLCRREGVTLFTVALTAFNTLLHRHSGQRDILVCTPVAGRDRMQFSDLIGYFNNTLLLRTQLASRNTFRDVLQATHTKVMNAIGHQMYPFKEVATFPAVARTPLSRAMVVVQNADDISLQLPALVVEKLPAFNRAMQYDLSLEMSVASNQLNGRLMYRKVLFESGTVEQLAVEYIEIINEMLASLDAPISRGAPAQVDTKPVSGNAPRPPYAAPRNDLERLLTRIWQDVMQLDNVGIYDGFFELGGHSLLALRLFTRIEQETGTSLPLSTLFGTTTIAHLAQVINGEVGAESWSCLIPIQPKGAKPPFFCVHGIGGGVIGYRDLSNFIGDDQPFYGLQAVGQDGKCEIDSSIEAMAARYVDVMRSQQPRGPYRIGGYCFGGVVAYEMAVQLEKMGQQVSVLAIFEGAMADDMDARVPLLTRVRAIMHNAPTWVKDYSGMSPDQLRSRISSTLAKVRLKFQRDPEAQRRARVQETLDIDINDIPVSSIGLTDVHRNAALRYAPAQINGAITLFRARNRSVNEIVFGSLDPQMGWGRYARGGVNVRLVDGFHRNMHLAPFAESLARELKHELDSDAEMIAEP